jgi:hypothetical protein
MPEQEQHQAAVACFVPGSLGGLNQPLHFAPGQVLPILSGRFLCVRHFVESSPCRKFMKAAPNGGRLFPFSTE